MTNSTCLKIISIGCASLFYVSTANAELCYCPKEPNGTECNNQCKGKSGGAVWLDRPPVPEIGTAPSPAAHDTPDAFGFGEKSKELKPEMTNDLKKGE